MGTKICKSCGVEQGAKNWVLQYNKPVGRLCKQCFNKRQLAKLHGKADPLVIAYSNAIRPAVPGTAIPSYILDNILISGTGCWEWQAKICSSGYGLIRFSATQYGAGDYFYMLVHRHVFEHVNNKELSPDRFVCHRCDNPRCCNPDHLFEGSVQDNNADKIGKGRDRFVVSSKQGPHMLKEYWQEIKKSRNLGVSRKALAEQYDTSVGTIKWIEFDYHLRN